MTQQLTRYFSSGIKRFFSGIFLSRLTGLGRDLVMAYAFGDHPTVAAFMVAFRFSNLLRRFFGEGPLQSAFIPHFEGLRAQDEQQAYAFFRRLTFLLVVILVGLTLVIEGGLGASLHFLSLSPGNREILQLTGVLMPCLLFICLYGINIAVLQCHNAFFLPSMAPALANLSWIAGALYLKGRMPETAMGPLAKWVVVGIFLQWLVTVPLMWKRISGGLKDWFVWKIHPEVKKLAKSFSLGALGVGAVQINAFFDAIFARCADPSGPVYLWYSIRFQQLALAIFGIAAVNTLVPILSRKVKGGEIEEAKDIFSFGVRRVVTVMLSITLAIFSLGYFAIDLVYGRGNFSLHAVNQTTICFWAYSVGLIPLALIMLYSAVFYAQGNFRTPTIASGVTVGINLLMNTFFIFGLHLGAVSTALATSLGAWINFLILQRLLFLKGWEARYLLSDFIPLLAGGILASLMAYGTYLGYIQFFSFTSHTLTQLFQFIFPACAFVGGLFVYARLRQNQDLLGVFRAFLARG